MVNRTRSIPMVFRVTHFGNEIMSRRLELGMTIREVSEMAKIHATTISTYERGEEANMKMDNFLDLCNLFDIDPREFFELEVK